MYSLYFILDSFGYPDKYKRLFLAYFKILDGIDYFPFFYKLVFSDFIKYSLYY